MAGEAPPVAVEAQAASTQARHGSFLSNALKDLAGDVKELDSLVPDKATADAPRTRPHFAPFLVSRTSPTWQQVKAALISTFSSAAEPDLQAVEPGPSGVAAVLFVLENMVDWEVDRNSVRQAIYSLSTAVTNATESIRSASSAEKLAERAQVERQRAPSPPVDRRFERLAATPSTREPSVDAPPEQRNAAAGPSGLSSAQAAALAERTVQLGTPVSPGARSLRASPAREASATPAAISSRTRLARRASDVVGTGAGAEAAAAVGLVAAPPRKGIRRSEGRSPVAQEVKPERVEEEQGEAVEDGAKETTPGPAVVAQHDVPTPTGSAITLPLLDAFLSLPHLLLINETTSIPLMDADASMLGPPANLPVGLDQELVFARPHLKNKIIEVINKGTRSGDYARSRNTLTLKQEMNLCGLSESRAMAPGQPLVLITSRAKCVAVVEAASRHHGDKDCDGINVLLREGENRFYKGWYVAVRAASVLLPRGPGAAGRLELVLRDILEGHCDPTNAKHGRAKEMLADWGFSGGAASSAAVMEQLEGDCEEDRVMHYVAMRCVGWDDESFNEWSRRRDGPRRR